MATEKNPKYNTYKSLYRTFSGRNKLNKDKVQEDKTDYLKSTVHPEAERLICQQTPTTDPNMNQKRNLA